MPAKMALDDVAESLDEVTALTEQMAAHLAAAVDLGERRRTLMLRLNREGFVSYRRLAAVSDLTLSRVIALLKKAREEQGITAPHPRGSSPNGSQ